MREIIAFNKTVIGHKHIVKNIPCEDFSGSFSDEYGFYDVAVVADGHGDPSCFRSGSGSRFAVETAMGCLREFGSCWSESLESFKETMESPREKNLMIKSLTDTIVSRWYDRLHEDIDENPLTEEELLSAGAMADAYRNGDRVEHIYGTTLMAALRIDAYLILIHQGDGRCDVFYADGTVDQPIPWDDRCHENVTTSMCDTDVAASIRNCVIDLVEKPVVACYLGSDGIEDSFRGNDNNNQEGTHFFYRDLTCQLSELDFKDFGDMLADKLSDLSREGSADDMSVAGIIYTSDIAKLVPTFKKTVKNYRLSEDKQVYEEKLASMERKYSVLQKKYRESAKEWSDREISGKRLALKDAELKGRILELSNEIENKRAEKSGRPGRSIWVDIFGGGNGDVRSLERELEVVRREQKDVSEKLKAFRADSGEQLKERYEKCAAEFKEYDAVYQEVLSKIEKINDEINGSCDEEVVVETTEETPEAVGEETVEKTVEETVEENIEKSEEIAEDPETEVKSEKTEPMVVVSKTEATFELAFDAENAIMTVVDSVEVIETVVTEQIKPEEKTEEITKNTEKKEETEDWE